MKKAREAKSEYVTGDSAQEIHDQQNPRKYFAMIPNIVDDSDLDPFERTLYLHYVRVGTCNESTATTATRTKMSTGKVCEARHTLEEKGWISIGMSRYGTCEIAILDRWTENMQSYSPRERNSPDESPVHHMNAAFTTRTKRSRGESKKNQVNNQIEKPISITRQDEIPREDERFGVFVKEVTRRTSHLTPRDYEKMEELWDEWQDLDAHIYALDEIDKRGVPFNFTYYEKCLFSWRDLKERKKNGGYLQANSDHGNGTTGNGSEPGGNDARGARRTREPEPALRDASAQQIPRVPG